MNISVSRERDNLHKVHRKSDDNICMKQDKCSKNVSKERKIKAADISSFREREKFIQKNMM